MVITERNYVYRLQLKKRVKAEIQNQGVAHNQAGLQLSVEGQCGPQLLGGALLQHLMGTCRPAWKVTINKQLLSFLGLRTSERGHHTKGALHFLDLG